MSPVAAGLIHMELNRGDGSLGTFHAVQAGLAMRSIWMLGSEEQKQRWLPGMARLRPARRVRADRAGARLGRRRAWRPRPRRDGDGYVLDGEKRWIGNGTIADVIVVWARDTTDGQVKGFLVEKDAPGYDATRHRGQGLGPGRAGRPTSPSPGYGYRPATCSPARAASRTPRGCSPRPGSPWPGARSATRSRPTRRR